MTQAKACLAEFKVVGSPVRHRQLQEFDQATLPMQLLDVLPAAIYVTDAEGRIIYFNDAAAELWAVGRNSIATSGVARGGCSSPTASRCRSTNAPWPRP